MAQTAIPQIHDRDRELLALLAEHRALALPQLAAALGVTSATTARRLRALAKQDLVNHQFILADRPATVWITRQGLATIGRKLPPPRPDLKGYRHDVGVGWLWIAARQGRLGPLQQLISEREMRSHDGRLEHEDPASTAARAYGVGIGGVGPRGMKMRHYPDLLLDTPGGHRVAVELELTSKSRHRLSAIMRAYAGDPSIDGVLYLVPNARLARKIEVAAREAHVSDLVRVQRIAETAIHGADPPQRSQARASSRSRPGGRTRAQEVAL